MADAGSQLKTGAGDGNRTRVSSLGSWRSAIELHPQSHRILLDSTLFAKLIDLTVNGKARSFEFPELTVAQLVGHMGLEGKRIAIERNGEIVPRAAYAATLLVAGDKLEIVGAVGGG